MISVHCDCGKEFTTKAENAGKKGKCPACGKVITIPMPVIEDDVEDWLGAPSTNPLKSPSSASQPPPTTTSHGPPQPPTPSSSAIIGVSPKLPTTQPLSRTQGTIIICLLLTGLGTPGVSWLLPPAKWEYRTIDVLAIRPDADSPESIRLFDFMPKTVPDSTSRLAALGQEGWDLTAVFLENETVHPNFGKENLVTGLQPNTRPQKLVCILKRRRRF